MTRRALSPRLLEAFQLFQANAGGIVGQNAKTSLALARAELAARDADVVFLWEDDPDCDWSFVETWDEADQKRWHRSEHFAENCALIRPCNISAQYNHDTTRCAHVETLAALCGITDADINYRRVIEAELAWEAIDSLTLGAESLT